MSDLIGKTLGPYRILEQIGVGGMSTVYKAYQPSMDRYVAVKILPHYLSQDPEFARRFQREARAIARLEHAHILPVHDYGEYEGIAYIVMRYVEAGTLKERMAQGPLPLDEIDRLVGQIGGALDYAHRLGVIHRDVKPGNVLMDAQGDTYLSDFGLARMMETTQQLTASGVGVGTPAYMSPEQGQGVKVDHRSDIYSLGVILYEMITGHVPYEAETPMGVVLKHISDPLPLPRTIVPNVPEAVEKVILKALAKDPAGRFQTAGEMVEALDIAVRKALAAEPTQIAEAAPAKPLRAAAAGTAREDISFVTRVERLWAQPRGKVALVGGAAAVLVVLGWLLSRLPYRVQIAAPAVTTTATEASVVKPLVTDKVPTVPLPTGATPVSTLPPSTPMQEPSSTPPQPESTPMAVQAYALPLNEPWDITYDGSELWVLFDRLLVRLELVEAEGRFRAAQQQDFPIVKGLTWDASRGEYWTVRGVQWAQDKYIDLVDRAGNTAATFTVPQAFAGAPVHVAWDGENLWVTSRVTSSGGSGALYKLQPLGEGGALGVIDSYAQPIGRFPNREASGMTWDGSQLWLLVDDFLVKLNQAAQPVCRIELSDPDASWWGWQGVAWDGQFLWVTHEEASRAYRVDPAACR